MRELPLHRKIPEGFLNSSILQLIHVFLYNRQCLKTKFFDWYSDAIQNMLHLATGHTFTT